MGNDTVKASKETEPLPNQLIVEPHYEGASFSAFYSNFASITHTKDDLCIDFCLIAPPHLVDIRERTATAQVVARIIIPPAMADGLIEAIKAQKGKLLKEEGRTVLQLKMKKSKRQAKK